MKKVLYVFLLMPGFYAHAAEPVPDKTVVLTFDDAVKSHLTVAGPLLKEYGFGATFFISHAWMNDQEHFMTWEEVAKLHEMGFEIGNHTWTHAGFNTPRKAARFEGELALIENALEKVGVPKPISFGWTGNVFGPECTAILEKRGYEVARRGTQPEAPYDSLELGPLFDPARHHQLLIPSTGDAYPDWELEHFKTVVDPAGDGKIAVVQFHGVPDIVHPWVHTPEERFREYMKYLKENGFHVIAMRDLLNYLPEKPLENDPMMRTRYVTIVENEPFWPKETLRTRENMDFWLGNMAQDHGYSIDEMKMVAALPKSELERRVAKLAPAEKWTGPKIKVLPYPGGRHPRIGFLEGAIEPTRGTKVSIFTPWEENGYMVLDLPEAIFSNLGLTYLAHTHIPTIWNDQNIENAVPMDDDWIMNHDGSLRNAWRLPNGIVFGSNVIPGDMRVDLELWLENGSDGDLTQMRTQICLMLKGSPGFDELNNDKKIFNAPVAAAKALGKDRWVLISFEQCGRAWGNEKCPCIHADPTLPNAAIGERVSVQGSIVFYEGADIENEMAKLAKEVGGQ